MTHLDEGTIQALLHGELQPAVRQDADRHLATCAACGTLVAAARTEDAWVLARLVRLDSPVPAVALSGIVERATRRPTPVAWRRAATIALVVAGSGGLAWAIPPLRARMLAVAGRWRHPALVAPAPAPIAPPATPGSGIALIPGERFAIRFEASQEAGSLRIRLVDRDELSVRASIPRVVFESRDGEIVVRNAGSAADYDVELPRTGSVVEVFVAGRSVLVQDGGALSTSGGIRDASGRVVLSLRPTPR